MDWIRRNWPDLIIGFALLAVIAGIIATLLSGGSFFPFGNSENPNPPSVASPQVERTPSDSPASAPETNAPDTTPAVTTEAPPPGPPVLSEEAGVEPAEDATGEVVVVSPEAPEVGSTPAEAVTPLAPGTTGQADTVPAAPASETPVDPQVALEDGESTALFPDAPYRISVGSYRDAANAERRAEGFSAAGYPVFIGQQADLSIVLVGPYNERAEAEAAVAAIKRDGLEAAPLLFELSEDPGESASVVETAAAAASETVSDAAVSVTQGDLSGLRGSYLQAGAYDSSEGARPQRERLESFGFSVAEVKEGSFIKLLVGPFNDDGLSSAQARLREQGVDHFVRTF